MKKVFMVGLLSGVFIFLLASCGDKTEEDGNNLVYGQVTNINETTVTIERGNYENKGNFKFLGEKLTYALPETVFCDDFETGDVVAVLFDGDNATVIADVDNMEEKAASEAEKSAATYLTAVNTIDGTKNSFDADTYAADKDDQSVILAKNESLLTIEGGVINKTGYSTDLEASSVYGLNAALAVTSGAQANANDITVSSSSEGADGVSVIGSKARAIFENGTVNSVADYSRGLAALSGGAIEADEVNITTLGEQSPCVYSAGNISLANSTGVADKSPAAAVEGGSNFSIKNCKLTGGGSGGVMFYQRELQTSTTSAARLIARNSEIESKSDGPLFYTLGTNAIAALTDTTLTFGSGVLADVVGNDSEYGGGTGVGKLVLKGLNQKFTGEIKCDANSKVKLILMEGSSFTGAIDTANTAAYSKVYLSRDSSWTVTADSYVGSLTNEKKVCTNIKSNGHNVYYDADNLANQWLGAETVELPGGGSLTPAE